MVVWEHNLCDFYVKLLLRCVRVPNVVCLGWMFHEILGRIYILLLLDGVFYKCQISLIETVLLTSSKSLLIFCLLNLSPAEEGYVLTFLTITLGVCFWFHVSLFLPHEFQCSESSTCLLETMSSWGEASSFVIVFLVLKSSLHEINVPTPPFFWLMLVWYVLFHLFTFSLTLYF